MKAIDCVLPPPTTALEDFQRWMNRMETQLRMMHYSHRIIIPVTFIEEDYYDDDKKEDYECNHEHSDE